MKNKNAETEFEGLVEGEVTVASEEKKAPVKKEQTPEDLALLNAGVSKLKEVGISENLKKLMELVPAWNAGDKEALSTIKEKVIESFGGSEKLKDYIDNEYSADVEGFAGICKVIPVLNNVKSFYGRREGTSTKKAKTIQISINGQIYSVDAAYSAEIAKDPNRKELLLSHPGTSKFAVAEEII